MLRFHLYDQDYQLNNISIFYKSNLFVVNFIYLIQIDVINIETTIFL